MAAKLVVTKARGGTRIALVGASGTELLSSKVFTEPRAKGATLRALKGLLGEGVVVDDQTVVDTTKAVAAASSRRATARVKPTAAPAEPTATAKPAARAKAPRRRTTTASK
jgi:hypothetical protein